MVLLLARLVVLKVKSFSKVPIELKEQVESLLKEQGYDTDGNRIITT